MGADKTAWKQRAAKRAAERPFFLAHTLAAYREARNWDDAALARFLACAPEVLPRLALCRRPSADPERFHAEVAHLAEHYEVDAERLTALLHADATPCLEAETGCAEGEARE